MRITPLDIQQMVFKISFRGYDKEEVNRFLEELAETVEKTLRTLGYSVSRNKPYAGGFITEHYGNPAAGLHAIQLEINRALLDSEQEVLVEARHEGRWSGRNRLGKLVHFEGDACVGELVNVRIERATAWSLQGTALPASVPA